jgi:hypothetical protein
MPTVKISELDELVTQPADNDTLVVVDASTNETKKITSANFFQAPTIPSITVTTSATFSGATVADGGTITTTDINGGTIDGTVIGGSSAAAGTFTTLTASGLTTVDVVRYTPRASAPASVSAGDIYFNSTSSKFQGYNGTDTVDIGTFEGFGVNSDLGGADNVGHGLNTLSGMVTGNGNAAFGSNALATGESQYSVAVGYNALKTADATGLSVWNTAVGYRALQDSTTAGLNTALGSDTLRSITTASRNVGVGSEAGSNLSSGTLNVFVGNTAGSSVTSGGSNTFVGYDAGGLLATGSNNTCIGKFSEPSTTSVSNEITLGNSDITTLRCNTTSISSLSDQRDKKDIVDSPYGLETIEKIKPRQFVWDTRNGNIKDGSTEVGFIAQELLQAGDNDVLKLVMDSNPEFLEAKPASLIPILVKAVQELSAKVKELESKQ